jgi:hypothetical protein
VLHPDTRLVQIGDIGNGVVATRLIPRGTITYVRCELDHTIKRADTERLWPVYGDILDTYGYVDALGDTILCWDHGRFLNHSCDASTVSPGYAFDVAVRDIHPGDEITNDYAVLNIVSAFECRCGSQQCRREVTPDSLLDQADRLDALVREAFPFIGQVAQPLWGLVREKDEVDAAVAGRTDVRSCREHYFPTPT